MYAIKIFDKNGKKVGELMTATLSDILSLINKGMTVINRNTGKEFTAEEVCSMMGVSESVTSV